MPLKNILTPLVLVAILGFFSFNLKAQEKKSKFQVICGVQTVFDLDYRIPGFAFDIGISHKLYQKFNVKLWYHRANSQYFPVGNPQKAKFGFTANPGLPSPVPDIIHDIYASYFIGQPTSVFFNGKSETYSKNSSLINIAINRSFGKGRYRFIPEFGASIGSNHQFNFFLKAIGSRNGIIETATSQANFTKTRVGGVNLSLNQEYRLSKKKFYRI